MGAKPENNSKCWGKKSDLGQLNTRGAKKTNKITGEETKDTGLVAETKTRKEGNQLTWEEKGE